METESENHERATQMLARVRRHMLTSGGALLLTIVSVLLVGGLGRHLFGPSLPGWWGALIVLCLLLLPAIGIYSAYTNARCPACGGNVAFQVSAHASLLSGRTASRQCRHCKKTIFDDRLFLRARRTQLVVGIVTLTVAIGATLANVLGH